MDDLNHLQQLAESLSGKENMELHECHCGKKYKHKKDLFRHERTIHAKTMFYCEKCGHGYNRKDAMTRHIKSCNKNVTENNVESNAGERTKATKRKLVADNTETVSKPLKIAKFETCNWCGHKKELLPQKKFCEECGKHGKECKWCHRPLPERFYGKRNDICDSCIRRRENYVQRGGNMKTEALKGTVENEILDPSPGNLWDVLQFFVDNQDYIAAALMQKLEKKTGIKWFLNLFVKFIKYNENNEAVYAEPVFRSFTSTLTNGSNLEEEIASTFRKLYNDYQNFERDGSGWSIHQIIKLEINSAEYVPLQGSSYLPLPKKILKKKAVLNIQNNDKKCFLWCVLAAIHPITREDHNYRVSHYMQYESELDVENIEMPMSVSDIPRFEKLNDVSINVFGLEKDDVYPLYVTNSRYDRHVNLLLISKDETRHYCLIKCMSRLLGDRTKNSNKTFYCYYCLHGYSNERLLKEHVQDCQQHGPQKVSFPKNEDQQWIYFNSVNKQLKVPFVIYADFESFTRPIYGCAPEHSKTTAYQKHEPSGFCYVIKCTDESKSKPAKIYRGPDVIKTFLDWLITEENEIADILDDVVPMRLSPEEERQFQEATVCHVCQNELGNDRVRDHDHLSGKYRGAAHAQCNLQLQFRKAKASANSKYFIPVVFHNLTGYDMHLIMASIGRYSDHKLTCIPNNMEKYISFTFGNLRFIDSLQFMKESLETLVDNLSETGVSKFKTLKTHFVNEDQQKLLLRKGVYPYDYMDDEEKFKESKLPPPSAFYNRLKNAEISEEDYTHAMKVWKEFQMQTMGDYHDLYLLSDVLLLADVFENFRTVCFENYNLDPAHYFTAPGLAWDAMLKKTGIKLQLLDDIDMVHMIQKGIRGGVSTISQKYARANNSKLPDYDKNKPSSYITYLDMNNLYGTAMTDCLPVRDFEWLSTDDIDKIDVLNIPDDADTGYILEVDLEYPNDLHEIHNDYPLAPETMLIEDDMLSPYTKSLKKKLNLKGKPSTKLVPNLSDKTKYVIHYRNLKQCLQYGMRLKKIYRVIRFEQSCWLKPYIDFNTEMRKKAKNNFEKDFYKLMNNSAYGKFLENIFKRMNVELVQTKRRMQKLCAKPNFLSFKIFHEDLVAVNLKKTNLVFNKPIYVGFCILDISKLLMYRFHYEYIKSKYGNSASLLFTDTDSLTYSIETDDLYEDMMENKHLFDTSNYDKTNPLYDPKNAKVLGKMKDETAGQPIQEFVGLPSKMYSILHMPKKAKKPIYEITEKRQINEEMDEQCKEETVFVEKKRAKGVSQVVIDKELKHTTYKDALFGEKSVRHDMNFIRSLSHLLYSVTMNKTSVSPYDDKRYVLEDGIHTLAHGNCKILK